MAKIKEVLRSVENEETRDKLNLRMKRIQTAMKPKKPIKCVNCGELFYSKRNRQQRCNKCEKRVRA